MSITVSKTFRLGIQLFLAAVFSAALFQFSYYADNKYTVEGPQPEYGALVLTEQDLRSHPRIYLIEGWEIYRDRLLSPEDFETAGLLPDEYVFIGQYAGFEGGLAGGAARSPHGSVTYRLHITLPPGARSYTLELPEIYSAYRLYINGKQVAGLGDPDPDSYRAETGNRRFTYHGERYMEIILAVSDHSHYYSGLIYPPAFGESAAVERVLNTKFAVRMAAIALSLGVGVFYLVVWFLLKKSKDKAAGSFLPLLYALLCACFCVFIGYPVVKTLWSGGMAWYSLETFAFSAMLLLVILIQCRVSALPGMWTKVFTAMGILVCCAALVFPRVMGSSLELMLAYSNILAAYSWVCALFLVISTSYAAYKNTFHSQTMLLAAMVFAASLIMYRLLPVFEPIRFGLFSEIAGAVFVILIGVVMANEVAGQFKMRNVFEQRVENVSRMMEMQKAYYTVMFEKDDAIKKARHDIRHHISVIRELTAKAGAERYSENLLGALSDLTDEAKSYCLNHSVNAVAAHYLRLAENEGIAVDVMLNIPEDTGTVPAMDLCVIVGNLLENALEACHRLSPDKERFIRVRARVDGDLLTIAVSNSFDGAFAERNGVYLSLKEGANRAEGIGLSSVKAICEKYRGTAVAEVDGDVWKISAVVEMG